MHALCRQFFLKVRVYKINNVNGNVLWCRVPLFCYHGFVAQTCGRDSLFESGLLAGFHEQAEVDALPNDELVLLQGRAEETWITDCVV